MWGKSNWISIWIRNFYVGSASIQKCWRIQHQHYQRSDQTTVTTKQPPLSQELHSRMRIKRGRGCQKPWVLISNNLSLLLFFTICGHWNLCHSSAKFLTMTFFLCSMAILPIKSIQKFSLCVNGWIFGQNVLKIMIAMNPARERESLAVYEILLIKGLFPLLLFCAISYQIYTSSKRCSLTTVHGRHPILR